MTRQNLLALALMVSVSVNLLIAGIVIGRAGQRPPEPPPGRWMDAQLDTQTRQLVRRHMAENFAAVRPFREELRLAMRDVREAVSATDYEPQALADALARMRDVRGRYEAFMHDKLAEVAVDLDKQQRAALLRAALQRGAEGKRGLQRQPSEKERPAKRMPPPPGP